MEHLVNGIVKSEVLKKTFVLLYLLCVGCSSAVNTAPVPLPEGSMASYVRHFLGEGEYKQDIKVNDNIINYQFTLREKWSQYFNTSKVCDEKYGVMVGGWCAKNGTLPMYYVHAESFVMPDGDLGTHYVLYENTGDINSMDWKKLTTSLGFLTKEQVNLKNIEQERSYEDKIADEKNKAIRAASIVMKSDMGTVICKGDLNQYHGLYKGYVEGKSKYKLRIRLFSHERAGLKFNDVDSQTIIWSVPLGWSVCD